MGANPKRVALTVSVVSLASAAALAAGGPLAIAQRAAAVKPAALVVTMMPGRSVRALPGLGSARLLSGGLHAYLVTPRSASVVAAWPAAGALGIQPNWRIRRAVESTVCTSAPAGPDYMLAAIDANGLTLPATTPPIAILDGGLDANQPQFAGRIRGAGAPDSDGHGTAVAAVAAAAGTNDPGVSPTSPVIPIKIFGSDGTATAADIVAGIGMAIKAGAGVINLSGAGPLASVTASDNQVVKQAIDLAFSHGILTVAASGNEGAGAPDVPAAEPHVISVGAIGESGQRARFSNYGLTLDLMAPGVQLTEPAPSTLCPSGYQIVDGTSFAAPAVAAAAALLEAAQPALSASQRFDILRTTARVLEVPGWNSFTGFGVLDVAAVLKATPPAPDPGEVDDDVYWVTGGNAAAHPPLLTAGKRRASVTASIERNKDPIDVYRVVLKRGERLSATVSTAAGVQLQLAVWDPKTGGFDISAGRTRHRLVARSVSVSGAAGYTARRAGTYFVSVAATRALPGGSGYTLALRGR